MTILITRLMHKEYGAPFILFESAFFPSHHVFFCNFKKRKNKKKSIKFIIVESFLKHLTSLFQNNIRDINQYARFTSIRFIFISFDVLKLLFDMLTCFKYNLFSYESHIVGDKKKSSYLEKRRNLWFGIDF